MDTGTQPIDLARLDDALFDRLYKGRIEPCFASNEEGRLGAVKQFKQRLLIGGGIVLAIIVLASMFWDLGGGVTLGLMTAVFAGIVAYQPLAKLGHKLKQEYCTAIAQAMGATFKIGAFDPPAFARLKGLRLVPGYARSSFEDLFSGAHKGARYELYEAHLEQRTTDSKGRTRYSTVFRGQLIRMHFPREFLGVTIVRRDAGVFNVFGGGELDGRKLERVRLVASEFEKAFEVWGTDQVEARYLLHPVMMERLIELEKGLHGKRLRCGFENGDLLVAVEGGNLFEPGDLFKPLVDPARARRIINEIAGVVKVMDQVVTAQSARPPTS
ncbi:DUF3137 domain-containing protein [Terricaulis silvestris]|uniref:DUF3137 domain-containing protein n=1 Tax=Terricaulis silvestris TaxID=2686094 RepID=A0A6I6MIH5_9CAUL|nr:DUF3137 domain-containing protein [Terricaulis silvestris]QGZ94895.1 hypothetical protein DSM104635_01729 [Terricaulis silvestris]